MKQFVYLSIISLLFGACATSKQVAFQDDAYDNTRETKVYASAQVEQQAEDDLYEDGYYLDKSPQAINNYCNCGGFYDPWRNCRNRNGLSLSMGYGYGYNNWNSWNSPYYYDPFYGYNYNPYSYNNYYGSSWGNPYSYNNYYGSQYSGNWSSTETGTSNVVYTPRGSFSTNHRGNPNTIGSNNPSYTRDFYNKRATAIDKSSTNSSATSNNVSRTSLNPTSRTRSTSSTVRTYNSSSSSSYSRGGTTTRSTNTNSNSSSTPTYNSSPSRSSSASPSTPSRSSSSSSSTSRRP